jgi:hypothetical protein
MVYTNRRTTMPIEQGLTWLFGSDLGVASSQDQGATWQYRGIVEGLAFEWGRGTYWAPEIFEHNGIFHMYVTYIRGIPVGGPPVALQIHHYTSSDLVGWTHLGVVRLHCDTVIDACVLARPRGGFRMWYKDEATRSTWAADSDDLDTWTPIGQVLTSPGGHEGPNVFQFGGSYWLIVDSWRGQLVQRSDDLTTWQPAGVILEGEIGQPHHRTDDVGPGLHGDVVVNGGRAWIFYFTHPDRTGQAHPTIRSRRSSIQVAELQVVDGRLVCDRDAEVAPVLAPPTPGPCSARLTEDDVG